MVSEFDAQEENLLNKIQIRKHQMDTSEIQCAPKVDMSVGDWKGTQALVNDEAKTGNRHSWELGRHQSTTRLKAKV